MGKQALDISLENHNMGDNVVAIYPGSFDPTTYGHVDIITRASKLTDTLIVAVLDNVRKNALFTVDERIAHLKEVTKELKNVRIESFSGLLVDFAKIHNAHLIIRGLRALTDFEYEFQMALTNRGLNTELETIFIPTSLQYLYISSSVVKEIANFGGDLTALVPENILSDIQKKLNHNN